MTDIQVTLLVLLICAVLLLIVLFVLGRIKRKPPTYSLKNGFSKEAESLFEALKECHLKNTPGYLENIKKLVDDYPEEPIFFLFAGDIARRSDPKKALEIHRDVLFRPSTSGKFRSLVLKHIADDYIALKQNQKALSVLKDSLKSASFPAAHLSISRIMENEGNFKEAYSELEKYIAKSDIKESALLKKIAVRAVNYFFKKENLPSALKWLGIIAKLSENPDEIKIVEYSIALIKGKKKKSAAYLKALCEAGEEFEILGRSLLIKSEVGSEINSTVEGKFSSSFNLFFNPELKTGLETVAVEKTTTFYGLLLSRFTTDEACKNYFKNAILEKNLFVCSNCKNEIKVISPVCRSCQKITGRKFKSF